MKILYVSSSTIPSRSANSVHVMKMCQALASFGHEVRLLCLKRPEHEEKGIDNVFEHYGVKPTFEVVPKPFPELPARQLIYACAARGEAASWKPDLVYGRYFPAMVLSGLSGFAVAWESHERIWDRGKAARFLASRLFHSRRFQKLVVISDALKSMYAESGLIEKERICVAHDAADPPPAALPEPPQDSFRAGYIGGVYPGRGIEMLLECARRMPDIEFHFVGGRNSDLEELDAGSIGPNVICHGYVPPEKVPRLRAGFHVLLAPYQRKVAVWGGTGDTSAFMSPLKIFEYMASGRPMICSDMPVLREVLSEKNSILAEPEDAGAWIDGIGQLRENADLGARIAEQAKRDFEEHYTWEIRANRILTEISLAQ